LRKRMLMLAGLTAMAFAAALAAKADAAAAASTVRMQIGVETFTPIQKANCYGFGGWWCRPGWHRICRPWGCRCVPC
jgi:hypothetical protein